MKRWIAALLLLSILLAVACQPTPEHEIVINRIGFTLMNIAFPDRI